MKQVDKRKKGFGILEVLLASLVVIIVLGGLVYLARNSMLNTAYRFQHSQATFLAQEGIEVVRQIRDTNYIDGDSNTKWNTLFFDNDNRVVPIFQMAGNNYSTSYNASNGKYELKLPNANPDIVQIEGTDFERVINVRQIDQVENNIFEGDQDLLNNAYVVDCIVTWVSARGGGAEVKITEMMTNSRQGL